MQFGITERGDAGLDLSWIDKLKDGNIIISKHVAFFESEHGQRFLNALLENKEKIILHVTCTGYGGSRMEPNVPTPEAVRKGVETLLKAGFPVSHIVLRTDPIIPTERGIEVAKGVWKLFSDSGIKRCRYSVIDMYPHVKERIQKEYGRIPFDTFQAPPHMLAAVRLAVSERSVYEFEACAENLPGRCGCISKKDFDILGLPYEESEGGFQRKGCLCCAGKTELLPPHKFRCPSGCLYCYWKDPELAQA